MCKNYGVIICIQSIKFSKKLLCEKTMMNNTKKSLKKDKEY